MWRSLLLAVCLTGITISCGGVEPRADSADVPARVGRERSPIQTDSLSYQLVRRTGEYRAYVLTSYRNSTPGPIYFERCGGRDSLPIYDIGRTGPDSLRRFFIDWAWACAGGVANGELRPGMSVTVRVPLGSIDQPNMTPPLRPEDLIGEFRVELALCASGVSDSLRCTPMPHSERRSNAFMVHY